MTHANSDWRRPRATGDPVGLLGKPWANDPAIGNRDPLRHVTDYETTGWQPACRCQTDEKTPCVVLDPFLGSGTTLAVAREWGRDGVGIELNPDYAEMARLRINQTQPRLPLLASPA